MALTDEEKKMFRAFNCGYLLSQHEPVLLDKIIKANGKNEFVTMMALGRDHHHIHANLPKKENTPEFRNGYYNGRTLAVHDPEMIGNLVKGKGLHKDYKRGLEAAQKEHQMEQIGKKIDALPKTPPKDLRNDLNYKKGFNLGYRFAERQPYVFEYAKKANDTYSKFLDGMKAGHAQYNYDLAQLRDKHPNATIFKDDPTATVFKDELINHKIAAMDEISTRQNKLTDAKDTFSDAPLPKWLQKKSPEKQNTAPQKHKGKDIDYDR